MFPFRIERNIGCGAWRPLWALRAIRFRIRGPTPGRLSIGARGPAASLYIRICRTRGGEGTRPHSLRFDSIRFDDELQLTDSRMRFDFVEIIDVRTLAGAVAAPHRTAPDRIGLELVGRSNRFSPRNAIRCRVCLRDESDRFAVPSAPRAVAKRKNRQSSLSVFSFRSTVHIRILYKILLTSLSGRSKRGYDSK